MTLQSPKVSAYVVPSLSASLVQAHIYKLRKSIKAAVLYQAVYEIGGL